MDNLPVALSSFIGRERESGDVAALLLAPRARLVTLTGAGGCGKTRLAIAVARRLVMDATFDHGAWFIDLAGLDTPALVPQTVAATLGVPEAHDRSHLESLQDFLQQRALLLILDNCEHLSSACADLARTLLVACPLLRILATSREPLDLPDETVWLVPSLALPQAEPVLPVEQLARSESIQLFVERARAALPNFGLDNDNSPTVAQICRRLDGIPLAIELAAARVKMLAVEQIAARLDDGLHLLRRGSQAAAPRHQTMRAALDWSFGLLSPGEQTLFGRLAVFAGGFALEAVESICPDDGQAATEMLARGRLDAADVLDLLSDLVDKSMALIAEREPQQPVRYRLLEPIRKYALDKLSEDGTEAATRDRHLAYFAQLAEQAEPELKSQGQLLWLKRLDKEHDNLRAALGWATRAASRGPAGLRLAAALHLFWQRRGYWSEGRRWLQQAIANYAARPDRPSPGDELCLAKALVAQGWLAVYLGYYANVRESLERGLAMAERLSEPATMAHAHGLLAFLSSYGHDMAGARQHAVAAVESARQSGERWSLAWTNHVLGRMLYYQGDLAGARAALRESEALLIETGDRRMLAVHINTMAVIAQNAGELETAGRLFEETVEIGRELSDQELQFKGLGNMAGLAMAQGDLARAEQLNGQLLRLAEDRGAMQTVRSARGLLGRIRLLQGDFDAAEKPIRDSLARGIELNNHFMTAVSLAGLSRIMAEHGQAEQAARVMGAADSFLKRLRDADDRVGLDELVAGVRAALTPEKYAVAFAAGQALTLAQAVQEVTSADPVGTLAVQSPVPTAESLYLSALGPMRVQKDPQALTAWPYAKVKELLFYLASYPARTKAQIGLALWPEASPAQLRNSLGTTLYHLRRALGNPEWIIFQDDQYCFNRALNYQFDVEAFESHLARANRARREAPQQVTALLREATQLYLGDFMEDCVEGEWFLLRREDLRRRYLEALLDLGQLLLAQGALEQAAEVFRQAIGKDPVFEAAHRELMRCYARLGERGQALRHYQTLEQIMQTELGSPPAPESVRLYERLKRGEEA